MKTFLLGAILTSVFFIEWEISQICHDISYIKLIDKIEFNENHEIPIENLIEENFWGNWEMKK